ncbi:C69 family dipeptidase [Lactobacillus delbrueckii]|uniref:C69 family dipeptidase n=1 Tax=Lactobacillus delbrueckii TaxID=1584 RepID=UPI0022B066D5|nr:C69 family dipeptidase [Lactobacillus delbrueckii]
MRKFIWAAGALGLAAAFTATPVKACTTVVVGKKATTDGSTLVARNEDIGAWAKHFYVHQATSNGPTTYVSEDNGFKTSLPKTALRYTSTPDGEQVNGQSIFGENGVNSENVAMSATESGTTNKKGLKADNLVKNGISEASMLDVILPYIHSAKEGVQRLGQIVEKSKAVPKTTGSASATRTKSGTWKSAPATPGQLSEFQTTSMPSSLTKC